jgi:hypothetical protein
VNSATRRAWHAPVTDDAFSGFPFDPVPNACRDGRSAQFGGQICPLASIRVGLGHGLIMPRAE